MDYIQGIITFHGDGTFTTTEKGIYQSQGQSFAGNFPLATYPDICGGTYQVHEDLSYNYEVGCTVSLLTGFNAGLTVRVDGIKYEGQVNLLRDNLVGASISDAVQTMTFSNGFTNFRVCGGETNAVKIPF